MRLLGRLMKVISPKVPMEMRGLLMTARPTSALVVLLQPRLHVTEREPQVLVDLVSSRRPPGQPPVVDGPDRDAEPFCEFLGADQGLQPQSCGGHTEQVGKASRTAPREPEPTDERPVWAALRTCQSDGITMGSHAAPKEESWATLRLTRTFFVAGAGFEPATSGL